MNRREILKLMALGLTCSTSISRLSLGKESTKKGMLLIPTGTGPKGLGSSRFPNLFHTYDLDANVHNSFEIPLALSHSCITIPGKKNEVVVLEKDGPKACIVNFRTGKVIKEFTATNGSVFSGHGLFDEESGDFLTTEFNYPTENFVVARDFSNLSKIKYKISDVGIRPHEMTFFGEKRQIALGHYGHISYSKRKNIGGEIRIIDLDKKKTIKRLNEDGSWYSPCHIIKTSEDSFFAASHSMLLKDSSTRNDVSKKMYNYENRVTSKSLIKFFDIVESPMTFYSHKTGIKEVETASKLKWTVGLAHDPSRGHLASTSTFSKDVTFWDTNSGMIIKKIKLSGRPSGIFQTLNKKEWIVIDHTSTLYGINSNNFHITWKKKINSPQIGIAPHIWII